MGRVKKKEKKSFLSMKMKIVIVTVLGVFIAGWVFFNSAPGKKVIEAYQYAYEYVKGKSGLTLKTVIVDGHARTDVKEINGVIDLAQGMPVFDVNLEKVRTQIMQLPWIKAVVVERQLPDTIYIHVVEKTPIAIWQNNKQYWPVDENGDIIKDDKTQVGGVLLVVGKDALVHTPELVRMLDMYPDIREKARSAVRIGDRRWNLILNDIDNGLVIYLPETNIELALKRVVDLDQKEGILKKDLRVIDVRLPDRFIVQTVVDLDQQKGKK